VDITVLRVRANRESSDLGPEPGDPHERDEWFAERHDAVTLLAQLANRDADVLRRASIGEWVPAASRDLLLDAAKAAEAPQLFNP
jgi:hypothetical protein